MPRTFFSIASLTTACLAAACFAPPVLAQGALKPVEALVVNPTSRPLPVTVIAPPIAAPAVTCHLRFLGSSNATPFNGGNFSGRPVQSLDCPSGVTRLDVFRVVFDPQGGFGSRNVAHYSVLVALVRRPSTTEDVTFSDPEVAMPLAVLTEGASDVSLARPVRIDKTDTGTAILTRSSCSSGIAGFIPECSGAVFLVGTPVN